MDDIYSYLLDSQKSAYKKTNIDTHLTGKKIQNLPLALGPLKTKQVKVKRSIFMGDWLARSHE